MKIQPLGNRVLVKLIKKSTQTASGIIISSEQKEEQMTGEIIALGCGSKDDDIKVDVTTLKIGQKIMFGKYGGEEIKDENDESITYKIIEGDDILATIE